MSDKLSAAVRHSAAQKSNELASHARAASLTLIIAACIGLFAAILCGVLLTRSITRPMSAMTEAAQAIAAGDVSQTIEYHSRDEIGMLAQRSAP